MSKSLERMREQWPLLVFWLFLTIAMFVYCTESDTRDDLTGLVLVVVMMQLMALPAVAHPAVEPPGQLSLASAVCFGLSLGMAVGFSVFFGCLIAGFWFFNDGYMEMRPILLALALGPLAAIATAIRYGIAVRRRPHPLAVRRGLTEQAILACVVLVITTFEGALQFDEWTFLVAVPLLWLGPLALLLPRRPRPPRAVAL